MGIMCNIQPQHQNKIVKTILTVHAVHSMSLPDKPNLCCGGNVTTNLHKEPQCYKLYTCYTEHATT